MYGLDFQKSVHKKYKKIDKIKVYKIAKSPVKV